MRTWPIFTASRLVQDFVERGLSMPAPFVYGVGVGFAAANGELLAGFVFSGYDPSAGTVEVAGYSTRRDWCTPTNLRALFGYPFDALGVRYVVARHSERNRRARRIWKALGAKQYRLPDLRGPGEAEIIAALSAEAWRASKFARAHGKAESAAADRSERDGRGSNVDERQHSRRRALSEQR